MDGLRTTTTESLLGVLSLRPMSGYDIRHVIENSTANFWSESFGQIYPALKKLVADGLATVVEQQPKGERLRKVYKLTPAGRIRLKQWLATPCSQQVPREELLLKLFFADRAPAGAARAAVQQRRTELQAELNRYAEIEKGIAAKIATHPGAPYWKFTLDYGKARAVALLGWCDQTLAELKSIDAKKKSGGKTHAR